MNITSLSESSRRWERRTVTQAQIDPITIQAQRAEQNEAYG